MSTHAGTDMFVLSEEHQAIREAVRAVADAKIAPYAADVDANARFPQEAADALLASDFHAPHVPEEYGGAGADALATVLVIEEVARACVSSSLIPAVNKLGSLPVQIGGGEEIKKKYLSALAAGEGAAETGDHRDAEGEGLAGAGLAAAEDVASAEGVGERVDLDGERARLAVLREGGDEWCRDAEGVEGDGCCFGHGCVSLSGTATSFDDGCRRTRVR